MFHNAVQPRIFGKYFVPSPLYDVGYTLFPYFTAIFILGVEISKKYMCIKMQYFKYNYIYIRHQFPIVLKYLRMLGNVGFHHAIKLDEL